MVLFESPVAVSYSLSIVIMTLSCIICEIKRDICRKSRFFRTSCIRRSPSECSIPFGVKKLECCGHPTIQDTPWQMNEIVKTRWTQKWHTQKNHLNVKSQWKVIWVSFCVHRYDTIRYDSVYLTCSKKLTGSQLSPPHGTNKKCKRKTKIKLMSMISPVQYRWCTVSCISRHVCEISLDTSPKWPILCRVRR